MSNYTYCRTLKLDWKEVSRLIAECAGKILDRTIHGTAGYEDAYYWGFQATTDRFTIAEIDKLIRFVNGDEEMQKEAIPQDSDRSAAIGESLSRALLEKALRLSWCHESTTESALWLVNVREKRPAVYKRIVEISPHDIYLDNLRSKSELIAYLHENGPTHSTLMDFCTDYRERYHNELCWNYPISDGLHLGTFFVLVKEGVLAFPYDDADKVDYELLCLDDAKMCDRESMENLINEWDSFNRDLHSAMQGMIEFYRREEEHHGSENLLGYPLGGQWRLR